MKEIIDWLSGIEKRARRIYERASKAFSHNREFSNFLEHLSLDESEHSENISKIAILSSNEEVLPDTVALDNTVKSRIEDYLSSIERRLDENGLTEDDIIKFMIYTEYSEWNDLFLYVVNTFKRLYREFIPVAVMVQQHKRYIERFIESRGGGEDLEKIRSLTSVWQESILVVDDEDVVADVVSALLNDEGIVDRAVNGEEALDRLRAKYYGAVITDLKMPVMDGIEFYRFAVAEFPNIKERFLFFTADEGGHIEYFRENGIRWLGKPAQIREIKEAVIRILERKTPSTR